MSPTLSSLEQAGCSAAWTFAAISGTQLAQLAAWAPTGRQVDWSLFLSLLIVVTVVHCTLAAMFAHRNENRPWASVLFFVPVSVGLVRLVSSLGYTGKGAVLVALVLLGAAVLYGRSRLAPGAPILAAVAGTSVGCVFLAIAQHTATLTGTPQGWLSLCLLMLVATMLGAATIFAGRKPAVSRPSPSRALLGRSIALLLATLPPVLNQGYSESPNRTADGDDGSPVVLIVLDTVRADHLRSYGYRKSTMPLLEQFVGDEGLIRVPRAISNSPTSLATHASFFTGLYPAHNGAHKPFIDDPNPPSYGYGLRLDVPTAAELLTKAGYWTIGISGNYGPLSAQYGLDRGFASYVADPDESAYLKEATPWASVGGPFTVVNAVAPFAKSDFLGPSVGYRRAESISDEAIQAIDAAADTKFFLFVNYFDAHDPYRAPYASIVEAFEDWRQVCDMGMQGAVSAMMRDEADLDPGCRHVLATQYDRELAYLDHELSRLLMRLRAHPAWEEDACDYHFRSRGGFGRAPSHKALCVPVQRDDRCAVVRSCRRRRQ